MGDDSVPEIEIDGEVTEATGSSGHSGSTTRPHATVEWLTGFDEGRRRGAADVLDALAPRFRRSASPSTSPPRSSRRFARAPA